MRPGETPSQTVGPYFSIGLTWAEGAYVVAAGTPGAVWIGGTVYDGAGDTVADALIETWQGSGPSWPRAVPGGDFAGFGRCPTDSQGQYRILTTVPASVDAQAPHLDVSVFARGLLDRVVTRIYFPDHELANAGDPVLAAVPDERRHTLLARSAHDGYLFDIHLQGVDETVFFDV